MPSSTAAAGPLVGRGSISFRVPDPDARLTGVRLVTDRGFPIVRDRFARDGKRWALAIRIPEELDRFEYALELEYANGECATVPDEGNPRQAPGAFGAKSVVELPGYAPPGWLDAPRVAGRVDTLTVASSALAADVEVAVWRSDDARDGEPLPLLVAHDGPELDALARLTDYAAAQIAAGRLPRHRVALLAPGDRDEWYSASALYARTLATRVLPAIAEAVAIHRPVGMGVSLGGLAVLHAEHRFPGTFAALFLQSGSFFLPQFDAQESGFPRYRRIVRAVRALARGGLARPLPIVMTCGALEENVHNNRAMARALGAHGSPTPLRENRDLHNYTGWRDCLHPNLTALLAAAWAR